MTQEQHSVTRFEESFKTYINALANTESWQAIYQITKNHSSFANLWLKETTSGLAGATAGSLTALAFDLGLEKFLKCAQEDLSARNWKHYAKTTTISFINGGLWNIWYLAPKTLFDFCLGEGAISSALTLTTLFFCCATTTKGLKKLFSEKTIATLTTAAADLGFGLTTILDDSINGPANERSFLGIGLCVMLTVLTAEGIRHAMNHINSTQVDITTPEIITPKPSFWNKVVTCAGRCFGQRETNLHERNSYQPV